MTREQSRWESELGPGSMVEAFRASLLRTAQRERMRKIRRMRALCALAGVGAGVVLAISAYSPTSSVALAVFALVLTVVTIAGGLSAVLVRPDRLRWAAYHALMPAVTIGALAASHALWNRWWLAVLVALTVWFLLGGTLAFVMLPQPPRRER